jgi:hypothetical protein
MIQGTRFLETRAFSFGRLHESLTIGRINAGGDKP